MTSSKKVTEDAFTIRLIQEGDLDDAVEIIKIENWFILKRSKMDIIYQGQLATFYVIADKSSEDYALGIASVCKTREDEAMLGNVIIRKEHRGKGLGTMLLRKVLERHSDIKLTWFSAADQFYKNLGCVLCEQQGFFVEMMVDREKLNEYCNDNPLEKDDDITLFTDDQREELVQYDAKARGYANPSFLSLVIRTSDNITMALRTSGTDHKMRGYVANCSEASGTLFLNGCYADDNNIAVHLLRSSLDAFPHLKRVRFYTLASCQFLVQFGTPSMALVQSRFSSKGTPAKIPLEKLFCLSDPSLSY